MTYDSNKSQLSFKINETKIIKKNEFNESMDPFVAFSDVRKEWI